MNIKDDVVFYNIAPFKETEDIKDRCNIDYIEKELKKLFPDDVFVGYIDPYLNNRQIEPGVADKNYFDAHPEWFPMDKKGKRYPHGQLCFSNEQMKKELTNKPNVEKINIGTNRSADDVEFSPAEMEAFEVAAYFGTDMEKGLTKQQIRRTRMEKGFNTLQAEYDTSIISSLKRQISGMCMPLMIVSLLITAAFADGEELYTPMAAILAAVMLISAAIDRYAASVLNKSLRDNAMRSTVLRDGKLVSVSSVSLVPADARLAEANHLMVLETPVTGVKESTVKEAEYIAESEGRGSYNMVYAGTIVTSGRARAIVCRTGNDCTLYRKAGSAEKQLPLMYHKAVRASGVFTLGVAALSFLAVMAGLLLGRPLVDAYMLGLSSTLCCMQSTAVSLGFGGFAAGVKRMYKSGAVLRRFSSVDTPPLSHLVNTRGTARTARKATTKAIL